MTSRIETKKNTQIGHCFDTENKLRFFKYFRLCVLDGYSGEKYSQVSICRYYQPKNKCYLFNIKYAWMERL